MKLTKFDRGAFVTACMDDVPKINYSEKIGKLVRDEVYNQMHTKIKAVYDDKNLRDMLGSQYVSVDHYSAYMHGARDFKMPADLAAQIDVLYGEMKEQNKRLGTLKEKLVAAIACCSTLKQARERLPEFEKYLPFNRDNAGTANLPAVANLVTDLMAAGWPKGETIQSEGEKHAA